MAVSIYREGNGKCLYFRLPKYKIVRLANRMDRKAAILSDTDKDVLLKLNEKKVDGYSTDDFVRLIERYNKLNGNINAEVLPKIDDTDAEISLDDFIKYADQLILKYNSQLYVFNIIAENVNKLNEESQVEKAIRIIDNESNKIKTYDADYTSSEEICTVLKNDYKKDSQAKDCGKKLVSSLCSTCGYYEFNKDWKCCPNCHSKKTESLQCDSVNALKRRADEVRTKKDVFRFKDTNYSLNRAGYCTFLLDRYLSNESSAILVYEKNHLRSIPRVMDYFSKINDRCNEQNVFEETEHFMGKNGIDDAALIQSFALFEICDKERLLKNSPILLKQGRGELRWESLEQYFVELCRATPEKRQVMEKLFHLVTRHFTQDNYVLADISEVAWDFCNLVLYSLGPNKGYSCHSKEEFIFKLDSKDEESSCRKEFLLEHLDLGEKILGVDYGPIMHYSDNEHLFLCLVSYLYSGYAVFDYDGLRIYNRADGDSFDTFLKIVTEAYSNDANLKRYKTLVSAMIPCRDDFEDLFPKLKEAKCKYRYLNNENECGSEYSVREFLRDLANNQIKPTLEFYLKCVDPRGSLYSVPYRMGGKTELHSISEYAKICLEGGKSFDEFCKNGDTRTVMDWIAGSEGIRDCDEKVSLLKNAFNKAHSDIRAAVKSSNAGTKPAFTMQEPRRVPTPPPREEKKIEEPNPEPKKKKRKVMYDERT